MYSHLVGHSSSYFRDVIDIIVVRKIEFCLEDHRIIIISSEKQRGKNNLLIFRVHFF